MDINIISIRFTAAADSIEMKWFVAIQRNERPRCATNTANEEPRPRGPRNGFIILEFNDRARDTHNANARQMKN